jgi:aminopeptidase YwaD
MFTTFKRYCLALSLLCAMHFLAFSQDSTEVDQYIDSMAFVQPVEPVAIKLYADSASLKRHINILCSKGYFGRGYVGKGMQKAGKYIVQQYKDAGLKSFGNDYGQPFGYSVNTFPGVVDVKIDHVTLKAGVDYLVNPASNGAQAEQLKLKVIDGMDFARKAKPGKESKQWQNWLKKMSRQKNAYLLTNLDTVKRIMKFERNRDLFEKLPKGIFLVPRKDKPIWSVAKAAIPATVIELYDSTITFNKKSKVDIAIINQPVPKFTAENIVGFVAGTQVPDSFIVITAHYDHLGKMGNRTMFPGASDNATGTAMMLELAKYYAANPAKYTMVFIAFAGEEAGLIGSKYFTEHPLVPLGQIRFLLNLDIMGDATNGISVVNGKTHEAEYKTLVALNASGENGFIFPDVAMGGPASNSDHYHFSEKGVPAFFIFTKGGKGYYHDIWDKAENVTLKNVPELGNLIRRFIATF